jgi:hypothetical protein
MRFSERQGFRPIKNVIQIDFIDEDLKNSLWNAAYLYYFAFPPGYDDIRTNRNLHNILTAMWLDYFKSPITNLHKSLSDTLKEIRHYFFTCQWYCIYDFIEFLATFAPPNDTHGQDDFINSCNHYLQREVSGYRFVNNKIAPITSEEQIASIERALQDTTNLKAVNVHLKTALDLFADRKNPDYRNSIKESISAVEALCTVVTNDSKSTLGAALREIEKRNTVQLHPSLRQAFDKLYGYTSAAQGIRHALGLLDEPNLDSEDAKFMLVSCSAFINYLIAKSSKAGIKL